MLGIFIDLGSKDRRKANKEPKMSTLNTLVFTPFKMKLKLNLCIFGKATCAAIQILRSISESAHLYQHF